MRSAVEPCGSRFTSPAEWTASWGEPRIAVDELLLPDLELRQARAFAHEVDAEVELARAGIARQHVVHRGYDIARLEVAAAEPKACGEEIGHLLAANGGNPRVRERRAGGDAAVLDGLRHRRANLAQQRRIHRERLVGAFHHHDALLPGEQIDDRVRGERPEHREVDDADLEPARRAQVIGDGLGVRDDGALADDHPVGVIGAIAHRTRIPAPGERGVFIERAIGEVGDVVEVERPLRRHAPARSCPGSAPHRALPGSRD